MRPPSGVICTFPSSLPTKRTPAVIGDSAIVVIVPKSLTPSSRDRVRSLRSGPIIASFFQSWLRVRSVLIASQVWPRSLVRNSLLPP